MTTIKMTNDFTPLTGQFLVAVPGIDDARFEHAVVYIYAHSASEGARGIVVNKPAEKLFLRDILAQMEMPEPTIPLPPLLLGGPDKITSGFILHSSDYQGNMTHAISADISLTATQDILRDIAVGKGPTEYLMALGCSTWRPGQLEDELMSNVWLTVPATHQLLFHTPYAEKWSATLKTMGIDSYRLSATAGKA